MDIQSWQAARLAELRAPDSWLGLRGLYWLQPGRNQVGGDESAVVRLPGAPADLGKIDWQGDMLWWRPRVGAAQLLCSDRDGVPTTVAWGELSFFVVERNGQLAARVRDHAWARGRPPVVLDYFSADPAWIIDAEWRPLSPPVTMEVPDATGELRTVEVVFKAVFAVAGQTVELLPMQVGAGEVFFVFRDRSSGGETYGAGRFLKAAAPAGGHIRLDFNRAYNPPCAFTPFATCPLPPAENWLPFAVPAGERKWVEAA
ncbi:DUF1684 domain-containing protein [Azonexus sp.]|jgi:uncharacterized protein (DUF1684 family)|uniref:DUF1684 domain-containing protein n=1 Tax=Azonexus sp. TaxID=1872668 RepID=UPI0028193CC7|nr:DUF1684 domain-containing protein [Azonexus sp.]MDR1995875.1 DUF1684 domain-containing protein [Azonexus sp.]